MDIVTMITTAKGFLQLSKDMLGLVGETAKEGPNSRLVWNFEFHETKVAIHNQRYTATGPTYKDFVLIVDIENRLNRKVNLIRWFARWNKSDNIVMMPFTPFNPPKSIPLEKEEHMVATYEMDMQEATDFAKALACIDMFVMQDANGLFYEWKYRHVHDLLVRVLIALRPLVLGNLKWATPLPDSHPW